MKYNAAEGRLPNPPDMDDGLAARGNTIHSELAARAECLRTWSGCA
ncbi:MAG: hypothetical protein K2O03_14165 [Lachnospiraceae bacterium]|nr:hypothetical protein [Lachnospiraceae bacterium]